MTQIPSESPYQNSAKDSISAVESTSAADEVLISDSPNLYLEQFSEAENIEQLPQPKQTTLVGRTPEVSQVAPTRWWGSLSVRAKATALAIFLGTAPVLTVSILAYTFANRAITDQVEQEKINRASQLANEIDLYMADRLADIQILSQLPTLTNPRVYEATPSQQKTELLDRYIKLYGVYDSAAFFDLEGEAVIQAKGDPVPNLETRDYFQRVVETGLPTINPPSAARTTGALSMHIAAAVRNVDTDEVTGMVQFQFPVEGLDKIAEEYATTGDRYFLVDNQGNYFLTSDTNGRVGKPAADHFASYAQLQAAQASGSTLAIDPDDGSEQLLTYVPLQDLAGVSDLNFGVLIVSDTGVAFAAQRQLVLTLVFGLGFTVFAVSTLATYLADRATRPIVLAAEAVEKIGQGDLETRLQLEGQDEVGVLGANINSMATQLQESLAAQAFEAAQERLVTAAKGSGVLSRSDLQDIFDQAISGARDLLNLDRVVIYRIGNGADGGVISESLNFQWSSAFENNISDACIPQELRQAYLQGRIVFAKDVDEADLHPEHRQLLERLQVRANLVVPIVASDRLFGLLIAHSCSTTREWQETEINFLRRLGDELGLSVYRVELLEQTANLAEEQRQLKEDLQRRALELLQEVDPISRGDLTTRAKVTADEIGTIADSYNATVDNLRKIVLQVQDTANQVVATTNVSESSIQTLSNEALQQAEEIAAALELVKDMADAVRSVAANAEQAELAVQQAAQTVDEGDAVINRTVEGIQAIRATVADTSKKVKHLGESSQKISKVVELISAFAAQTNMLALNASIEASRAGEEGKGFAVVANEVRMLARQSAEATEEIRSLIVSIQAETNEVVAAMESGIEQVVTGTKLVDETRQSLNKITAVSFQIGELVEAIAQATVAQSEASTTVTQTMKDVAAIASKTSTEASQVSSTFEQLRQVAQNLQAGVGQFKV